jgi:hypothetical protein
VRSDPDWVTVSNLMRRFPGVLVWRGAHTGTWWAYVPIRGGRLVEAISPEELALAISQAGGWPWPK